MNLDDRLTRLGQIQKQFAALHAEQFRLIAEIADDPCPGAPAPVLEKQFVTEELRAVLGVSADWVKTTVGTARLLTRTLPATLDALGAGELTVRHALALCEAVAALPDADAHQVEQACVPFAAGRDYPAFVRKIRRELHRLDSRSLEQRFQAALDDRRVWCSPNDTGATQTFGAVLPAAGAQTLMTAIHTAATDRPTGDPARWRSGRPTGWSASRRTGSTGCARPANTSAQACRSPLPPPPCSGWTTNPANSTGTARSRPPTPAPSPPTPPAGGGG